MSKTVDFTWNTAKVNNIRKEVVRGMLRMGADIASKARFNAPYLTGALRNSIRITTDSQDSVYVLAGGEVKPPVIYTTPSGKTRTIAKVDYALLREFHNRKHPSTTHYMSRAFDSVTSGDITKYFGGIK